MLHKQHNVPEHSWSRLLPVGLLVALATGVAVCQTSRNELPEFEVASVKPAKVEGGRYTMKGGPGTSDPDRITYTNIMLRAILLSAYDVKTYQISAPQWIDTLRFDITAKLPGGATKEQFHAMLRNLLESRFKMTLHRESKELPVYALLVAKNGPKIKPTTEDGTAPIELGDAQLATIQRAEGRDGFPVVSMPVPGLIIETKNGTARITAKAVPLSKFADILSSQVGRPVLDTTGLAGNYSFLVYFTPEGASSGDSPEPGIFGAVQEQLGLRLEARKAAVELLVIDHAEKVPTGN
jgi:uncharacterized protein (TIGR03435 family)